MIGLDNMQNVVQFLLAVFGESPFLWMMSSSLRPLFQIFRGGLHESFDCTRKSTLPQLSQAGQSTCKYKLE